MSQKEVQFLLSQICQENPSLYLHSCLVGAHWVKMAGICGYSPWEIESLLPGALFHDIGKKGIALVNRGCRKQALWGKMEPYPPTGGAALAALGASTRIIEMIRLHHERGNDKGDCQLPELTVPKEVRILSLANTFTNLITARAYQKTNRVLEALKEIKDSSGTRFDPEIVATVTSNVAYNPQTYQRKTELEKQIEREKQYLRQLVDKYKDCSHPLVYGQSAWLDILLVEGYRGTITYGLI